MKRKMTQSQIDDEAIRRGIRATAAVLEINIEGLAGRMNMAPRTLYKRISQPGTMTVYELRRAEILMRSAGIDWRSLRESIQRS